jgi:hypothetical protein
MLEKRTSAYEQEQREKKALMEKYLDKNPLPPLPVCTSPKAGKLEVK